MRRVARVLMTADAVGGVWQYALQLASLLSDTHGIRVLLATMGPAPSVRQRAEAAAVPGLTLIARDYALEWMPDAWRDVDAAGAWLLGLEREYAPDVVHLNGYSHADLPWQAPTVVVAHSCVCSWWESVHQSRPPAEWDTYVSRVGSGLGRASAVIAPSRWMGEALRRWYAVEREIQVIPNGRVTRAIKPRPKETLVFAAGRLWDPAKNLTALDEAAAQLPWPVYVAGDASAPTASSPSALRHAHALGRLTSEEVLLWMSRAAIYALPARYEPFGLSVLEAARSGCALVLGDIPSLRENWDGAAYFVPPTDSDALRDAVSRLIARPGERESLAHAARRRAAGFDADGHVRAYATLYEDLVTAHDRTAHPARAH